MSLRSPAARIAILLFAMLYAAPGRAGTFVDAAGRHVAVPAQIERVMAADPAAAVLVFVLAPQKLIGWPQFLSAGQRRCLPAKFARLPATGRLWGPNPTAGPQAVMRWRPDLVVAVGPRPPAAVALADRLQTQTRVPVILLPGSIERTPATLRQLAALLGVAKRGHDLADYADRAIAALRGRLLTQSANDRPQFYYGKGPDGLETPLFDSSSLAAIEESGAIDVAAPWPQPARGLKRIAAAQLRRWNPDVVIAEDRGFAAGLRRDRPDLKAVRDKRVYAPPDAPFGWIDDPPGVNRLIGLRWLSAVMYPGGHRDLGSTAREFYQQFYGVTLSDPQTAALVRQAEAKPGEFSASNGAPGLLAPGAALSPTPLGNLPPAPNAAPPGRSGIGRMPPPSGRMPMPYAPRP